VILELVTNAGEVGIDRVWLDMVAHVNGEETQSFGGGFDGKIVHFAKGDVRIQCRSVCG
jgi:hypothetical protein